MSKSEYHRQSERYKQKLVEAKGRLGTAALDLRKTEQHLARLDTIVDVVRTGNPEEEREAIDALIKRAEEKDGTLITVTFRQWAKALLT